MLFVSRPKFVIRLFLHQRSQPSGQCDGVAAGERLGGRVHRGREHAYASAYERRILRTVCYAAGPLVFDVGQCACAGAPRAVSGSVLLGQLVRGHAASHAHTQVCAGVAPGTRKAGLAAPQAGSPAAALQLEEGRLASRRPSSPGVVCLRLASLSCVSACAHVCATSAAATGRPAPLPGLLASSICRTTCYIQAASVPGRMLSNVLWSGCDQFCGIASDGLRSLARRPPYMTGPYWAS